MTGNNNKAHGFITFGGWIADGIEVLGFKATKTIDDMCRDLANWMKQNPNGYEGE